MSDISIKRPHGMNTEEAKAKVHGIVADIEGEFPSLVNNISWNDDKSHAKVKGKGFTGQFQVTDSDVMIDIDLSLFARPFKGKVEERIVSRMSEYFG
ncbi:hypothetical protein DL240_05695 [Lujinxingia litoralis]|uniref:Polyhydroxyalkanoic acid system protein n=1 Tax=Lujinxingia litoralis TaxID=2211119 RepID=A0A328C918_9DELT|nr:polyhydroxyalkanoic acid system family protein [Lujinxingia litoralis]RAL23652.1 hypothetical protein DL240_05695 [Lujinxingia litoralis]